MAALVILSFAIQLLVVVDMIILGKRGKGLIRGDNILLRELHNICSDKVHIMSHELLEDGRG